MQKQVLLTIIGRVQGVFFRAETQKEALRLNIKGYAKNNIDGSVTVCALGEEKALEALLNWCKNGPELAKVEHITVEHQKPQVGLFKSFDVL